jgi:hypothetical protein
MNQQFQNRVKGRDTEKEQGKDKQDRQGMYKRTSSIEARSYNRCCCYCGKAINITQPTCIFVALGTQHEMRISHIFICGLLSVVFGVSPECSSINL